jgi:hypothetical protein
MDKMLKDAPVKECARRITEWQHSLLGDNAVCHGTMNGQ